MDLWHDHDWRDPHLQLHTWWKDNFFIPVMIWGLSCWCTSFSSTNYQTTQQIPKGWKCRPCVDHCQNEVATKVVKGEGPLAPQCLRYSQRLGWHFSDSIHQQDENFPWLLDYLHTYIHNPNLILIGSGWAPLNQELFIIVLFGIIMHIHAALWSELE